MVAANGGRFHLAISGEDDGAAPLVLLLHAFPQFWWAWRSQREALAARGYRVAAMDLRGYAGSDEPPAAYAIPSMAGDVRGVIRRSEEHTSELQSRGHLVCRLLLEKKNNELA